jgi:tripartite-type tricarboxylate transporter receptor subunit TctC
MQRVTALLAAGVVATLSFSPASAQNFPNKPVRFILTVAPGGGLDITVRAVSQKLSEIWGQTVVVDNRAGASGMIALDTAAKSPPDGYTIVVINSTHAGHPVTQPKAPYDLQGDFAPVTQMTSQPYILVSHPSVQASNVKELLAVARTRPGGLTYGSSGNGGLSHLAGAQLALLGKTPLVHVPYKGGGPALVDLLGGQINILFATPLESIAHIKNGRIRAYAVSTVKRSSVAPDLPTLHEAGVTGFEISGWYGVGAPAATPGPIVARLNETFSRALRMPDLVERFARDGVETVGSTPEQFRAYLNAEIAKWKRAVASTPGFLKP